MKTEAVVKSLDDVLALGQKLQGYDWKKPLLFTWKPYSKKRSLSMNALSHIWYSVISKATSEPEDDVKAQCKLTLGVPILLGEDEDFRHLWLSVNFNYIAESKGISYHEAQLLVVREFSVTSRMNRQQMSRYLTHMQQTFARAGIILESSGEYEQFLKQEAERYG